MGQHAVLPNQLCSQFMWTVFVCLKTRFYSVKVKKQKNKKKQKTKSPTAPSHVDSHNLLRAALEWRRLHTLPLSHLCGQVSYLCVLRAVGRSAGTQPDQKSRIRQLVGSTILIFLGCFSPYHVFLLVRTLLERDCNFIAGTRKTLHPFMFHTCELSNLLAVKWQLKRKLTKN